MPRSSIAALMFLLLVLIGPPALADSWLPPSVEQSLSADKQTRATIGPRPLDGALAYFEDKVAGEEPAGQRKGAQQTSPIARIERRNSGGKWELIWQKPLVNDVGPVSALVANGGRYLVTFDNWHSAGFGDDTVVIYDVHGALVRKMALTDFLPAIYVQSLPRSVSSIWWGQEHILADGDETLVLRVVEPGADMGTEKVPTVDVRVNLADGRVLPRDGAEWDRAFAKAKALDQERRGRWQALRMLRAKPLKVPQGSGTKVWRKYLEELRARLNASVGKRFAGAVLPASGHGNYPDSADDITAMLEEFEPDAENRSDYFVFVSPSSTSLATLLTRHLTSVKRGSMKGASISFVGSLEDGRRVVAAASGAGAEASIIDASLPYPGIPLAEAMPAWFQ